MVTHGNFVKTYSVSVGAVNDAVTSEQSIDGNGTIGCQAVPEMKTSSTQTYLIGEYISKTRREVRVLHLLPDFVKNHVKFYTGMCVCSDGTLCFIGLVEDWCVFEALLDLVEDDLPSGDKLCKYSKLVICLLKLRLNLFNEDIAHRFDVSPSTVSRTFHDVLDVLFVKTRCFIKWPDRDALRKTI